MFWQNMDLAFLDSKFAIKISRQKLSYDILYVGDDMYLYNVPQWFICSERPNILVSGDDDGRAYILEPLSSDPTNWNYKKNTIFDAGSGTVGQMAFADVDGDGYNDIFIPSYNQATVHVYTFAPYIVFG